MMRMPWNSSPRRRPLSLPIVTSWVSKWKRKEKLESTLRLRVPEKSEISCKQHHKFFIKLCVSLWAVEIFVLSAKILRVDSEKNFKHSSCRCRVEKRTKQNHKTTRRRKESETRSEGWQCDGGDGWKQTKRKKPERNEFSAQFNSEISPRFLHWWGAAAKRRVGVENAKNLNIKFM